eukprot:3680775-Amphidinium_carterae.2
MQCRHETWGKRSAGYRAAAHVAQTHAVCAGAVPVVGTQRASDSDSAENASSSMCGCFMRRLDR